MTPYDLKRVTDILVPRIGFRQTKAINDYQLLDAALIADPANGQQYVNALSERYFRVETMADVLDFFESYNITAWDGATNYAIGDYVKTTENDRIYIWVAKTANTNLNPRTNPDDWKSALSQRLEEYRESAASEVVSAVLAKHMNEAYTEQIHQNGTLTREFSLNQDAQLSSRFMGIILSPRGPLNHLVRAQQIGLYLTGPAGGSFKVHLYHTSQKTPIATYTITPVAQDLDSFTWYNLEDDINGNPLVIDYMDEAFNSGGQFILGVFEDEVNAAGFGYKFQEMIDYTLWHDDVLASWSVEIPNNLLNGSDLPAVGQYYDSVDPSSENMLNLRMSVEQSFYPKLLNRIAQLDEVYQLALAMSILRDMMQSDRINRVADNSDAKIDELLYGSPDNEQNQGLAKLKEIHLKKLLSDFDREFDDWRGAYQGAI
jgi:hypothetical protein